MKIKSLMYASAVTAGLMLSSCGDKKDGDGKSGTEAKADTPESLANEVVENMTGLVAALKSVKDEASADAAVKKIGEIGDEMVALSERAKKVPEPSEEKKKELDKMMEGKMESMQEDMMAAMGSLMQKPELMEKIGGAMKSFGEKMEKAEEGFKHLGKGSAEGDSSN